eukprot:2000506-Rhodomonas_salina.2
MNGKVQGLLRPIRNTRTTHKSFCSWCYEANTTRQNFSDSSDTVYKKDRDSGLWQWDMFEMGQEYLTLDCNHYATIFISRATCFVLLFLHKDKTGDTVATMLNQARAKFGYWPAVVRSDNAPEYDSPEVNTVILVNNIDSGWRVSGSGVRVLLLQSGLPPEFWGLAVIHVVTVSNCLPHASLDFQIPYSLMTGKQPDVSWFHTFRCSSVVYQ